MYHSFIYVSLSILLFVSSNLMFVLCAVMTIVFSNLSQHSFRVILHQACLPLTHVHHMHGLYQPRLTTPYGFLSVLFLRKLGSTTRRRTTRRRIRGLAQLAAVTKISVSFSRFFLSFFAWIFLSHFSSSAYTSALPSISCPLSFTRSLFCVPPPVSLFYSHSRPLCCLLSSFDMLHICLLIFHLIVHDILHLSSGHHIKQRQ